MKRKKTDACWKRGIGAGLSLAAAILLAPTVPGLGAELSEEASRMPEITKAGSVSVSSEGVTYDEPFATGTAGCKHFRIPALITLQDGTLLATADARWETTGDGGGIDSIASISEDGGKTWQYSFPLYFPDSVGYAGSRATTIIDPGVMEGPDGTIYFIADVNPTGSTTMYKQIPEGTGYVEVENEADSGRFLALTENYQTSWDVNPEDGTLENYPWYVSKFDKDGFAKILKRSDGSESGYGVDEWYNLYTIEDGTYVDNLRQSQVNSSTEIQQNAFYKDSKFHVYSIDYLWVITSTDGGKTWEHPRDMTDQIKRHRDEHALLVSPGQGITTSKGDAVIGFYDHGVDEENASVVYTCDNGRTWKRTEDMQRSENGGFWTSENEIVELLDGTLRMFARNGRGKICYADITKDEVTGDYIMAEQSVQTDVSCTSTCNVTAISYSKKINGKQAILVGCPTGGTRAKGKLFTFLVEEDNTMTLFSEFSVPGAAAGYVYSCLTEMEDGTVALLWEPNDWGNLNSIYFDKFSILDICPEADLDGVVVNVELTKGETYSRTYLGSGECSITQEADEEVAKVETSSAAQEKEIRITGAGVGYTETVIDGVTYQICVKDNAIYLPLDADPYYVEGVSTAPENTSNGVLRVAFDESGSSRLFDHTSNTASSLDSFSSSSNKNIRISDAEFTFTGSGTAWRIYNESKNVYLTNGNANSFFSSAAEDLKVTPVDGGFRICKSNGQRYIIFYFPEMNFNANTDYQANYGNGSYELTLLEKKQSSSGDDIVPGYQAATEITSGKKYLIAYQFNGSVIVLYPENGTGNQTKLVRKAGLVTITPETKGEASLTIENEEYHFKVMVSDCSHSDTVVKGGYAQDCLKEGYTGDTYCTNPDCGMLLETGSAIPAHGSHDWDDGESVKDVTETENGEKIYTCQSNPVHKKTEVIYSNEFFALKDEYVAAIEVLKSAYRYEETSLENLKNFYEDGKGIIEGMGASRGFMMRTSAAIREAIENLTEKTSEQFVGDLTKAVADAKEDFDAGRGELSESVWNAFAQAYTKASNTVSSEDDKVIWERTQKLKEAWNEVIKEKQDIESEKAKIREKLLACVNEAKGIFDRGQGQYTQASWSKFSNAYKKAADVSKDASLAVLEKLLSDLKLSQSALAVVKDEPSKDDGSKEEPGKDEAKAGDSITANGVLYRVTDAGAKTAEAAGATKDNIKIENSVTIKNQSFTVTSIAKKAFFKSKVKKATIGAQVTSIGDQAFSGCTKLSSVVIGAKVSKIGKQAFFNCKKLKTITLNCKNLKTVHKTAFKKTPSSKVTVKMPKGLNKSRSKKLFQKLKSAGISKKAKMK